MTDSLFLVFLYFLTQKMSKKIQEKTTKKPKKMVKKTEEISNNRKERSLKNR